RALSAGGARAVARTRHSRPRDPGLRSSAGVSVLHLLDVAPVRAGRTAAAEPRPAPDGRRAGGDRRRPRAVPEAARRVVDAGGRRVFPHPRGAALGARRLVPHGYHRAGAGAARRIVPRGAPGRGALFSGRLVWTAREERA